MDSVFFSSAVLILVLVLVTEVSHQNECDHTQVNHTLNNWCQYCYSLVAVGLPNLNKSKRLLNYCSITVLLSAEQHAHFRGKLRPADEN